MGVWEKRAKKGNRRTNLSEGKQCKLSGPLSPLSSWRLKGIPCSDKSDTTAPNGPTCYDLSDQGQKQSAFRRESQYQILQEPFVVWD